MTCVPTHRRLRIPVVLAAIVLLIVAGCSTHPTISTDSDGLRTFKVLRNPDGSQPPCAAFGLTNPVSGKLEGQAGSRERVWLEADDGRHLSVVWPEGFKLRFEPNAVIYNERGAIVARSPDRVVLTQTRPSDAAGTFSDPYFASGLVFGGCYPVLMT